MIRWWCSGQFAVPWTWTPQPYLGIWLVLLGVAAGYGFAVRAGSAGDARSSPSRSQIAAFVAGWIVLWITTDWPVGTLAAGYLLSAATAQVIVYYYVVAPLFVYAIPRGQRARWLAHPMARPLRVVIRHVLAAFLLVNAVLVATHLPPIADELKRLQLGTMVMDLSWLATACLFWWALDDYRPPSKERRFAVEAALLFGSNIVPTLIGIVLTFSRFPLYTTYEFANRVAPGFTALGDQQAAGLLMWVGTVPLFFFRFAFAFHEAFVTTATAAVVDGAE